VSSSLHLPWAEFEPTEIYPAHPTVCERLASSLNEIGSRPLIIGDAINCFDLWGRCGFVGKYREVGEAGQMILGFCP
jgi:hypothetical protein